MPHDLLRHLLRACLCAACLGALPALAQGPARLPTQDAPAQPAADQTGAIPDASATPAALEVTLVNPEDKAKDRAATVQVEVRSLRMTDPDATTGKPMPGEGHIHYQLDDGPVIATTATKLGFHELTPGNHLIKVTLAGNDHRPVSAQQTVNVQIPQN
jgi:hypothetical protein